jgi:hypothetical protein
MANLPKNAHVSTHPCLQAKLSQLRSTSTPSKDVPTLVHEIATMVGYEALASGLTAKEDGNVSHAIPIFYPKANSGASSPHHKHLDPSIHIPPTTSTIHTYHAYHPCYTCYTCSLHNID